MHALWWDQNALTNNSINHKNYFLMGSINLLAYDSVGVLYINKEMLTANNLEAPYQLVRDGKWTFDAMLEMCMNVSADLDGNNIYDEKDSYGLGLNSYGAWTFSYGGGLSFVDKNGDDMPYLKLDDNFIDFFQMFVQSINGNNAIMYGDKYGNNRATFINNAFKEGRLLFLNEMFNRTALLRDMEMDFGLLPMPKANEEQETYRHFIHQGCSSVTCVPVTVSDLDYVGSVLEDMAYYSYYKVYPTYIETSVKTKYLRDEESVEMADIILNNIIFDLALTMNSPILADLRTMLTKNDINITSKFDSKMKACEKSLDTAIEGYLD